MVTETLVEKRGSDHMSSVAEDTDSEILQIEADESVVLEERIYWNMRPQGPQGEPNGAEARQRARIKNIELAGRGILLDEALTGDLVVISKKNGGFVFEHVRACEPIPEREMVPGAEVEPDGVFTPLIPVTQQNG